MTGRSWASLCSPRSAERSGDGLGINCTPVDGKPAFSHVGLVMGYIATLHAYPDQDTIVALVVNGSFGRMQEEIGHLADKRIPRMLE